MFRQSREYVTKSLKEEWEKEKKSLQGKKSRNQPLGDKDDPVDVVVRVAATFIGTISEAYQYRKEKNKTSQDASDVSGETLDTPQGVNEAGNIIATELPSLPLHNKGPIRENSLQESRSKQPEDFSEASRKADENQSEDSENPQRPTSKDPTAISSVKPDEDGNMTEPGGFANAFILRHPLDSTASSPHSQIELPVVIPQRRPKNRARGFVRAYSPVLASAGIGQLEFLDFIDSFNRALVPSEWIQAIELIGWAGMAAPEPVGILLDQALEVAVRAATEAQCRYRGGRFIDRVNADYFIPRGLVAMLVTWKSWDESLPGESSSHGDPNPETQNANSEPQTVAGSIEAKSLELAEQSSSVHTGIGITQSWNEIKSRKATPAEVRAHLNSHMRQRMKPYNGVFNCSQAAPLVFPAASADHAAMVTKKNGKKMNRFDRGEQWINGFRDRRAQVKWVAKSPDSQASTTMQKHEFRSRYADPSHPAASGDIVAFATGGKWSTRGRVKQPVQNGKEDDNMSIEEARAEQKWLEKKEEEDMKKRDKARKKAEKTAKGSSGLSNLLRTDVLYLIIMNLPSQKGRGGCSSVAQQKLCVEEQTDTGNDHVPQYRLREYCHVWDDGPAPK